MHANEIFIFSWKTILMNKQLLINKPQDFFHFYGETLHWVKYIRKEANKHSVCILCTAFWKTKHLLVFFNIIILQYKILMKQTTKLKMWKKRLIFDWMEKPVVRT